MERFDFLLQQELAIRFRKAALEKGKYKKGSITCAIEEAILLWLKNNSHSKLAKNYSNRVDKEIKK